MNITECQLPQELLPELMKRLYDRELNTSRGGNISIQVSDGRWCTPSALDKATLKPDDMMFFRNDGVVFGKNDVSLETYIHMNIMDRCKDRRAIIHVHALPIIEFSIANIAPKTDIYPTCVMDHIIPVTPFQIPGSQELADTLVEAFNRENSPCVILANHGAFFAQNNIFDTVATVEATDSLCRTMQSAACLGTLRPMPKNARALLNRYRQHKMSCTDDHPVFTGKTLQIAQEICKLSRRAYSRKLFNIDSGIYAARVDANSFLIMPDRIDRLNINPEDMILIKDGKMPEGVLQPIHADFCMKMFNAYPSINSIIIAQPACAMIFACSNVQFESTVLPESYSKLRNAHYVPFGGLHIETPSDIAAFDPQNGPVTFVENECIVCTSESIFNCFECCELVEEYARIQVHIAQMKQRPVLLTDKQLSDVLYGEAHKRETDLERYSNRKAFK